MINTEHSDSWIRNEPTIYPGDLGFVVHVKGVGVFQKAGPLGFSACSAYWAIAAVLLPYLLSKNLVTALRALRPNLVRCSLSRATACK